MIDWDIFNKKYIEKAYEVVGEWEINIGGQNIFIKVMKDKLGKYVYKSSHYYLGTHSSLYIAVETEFETIDDAVREAVKDKLRYYDPEDFDSIWVINGDYF